MINMGSYFIAMSKTWRLYVEYRSATERLQWGATLLEGAIGPGESVPCDAGSLDGDVIVNRALDGSVVASVDATDAAYDMMRSMAAVRFRHANVPTCHDMVADRCSHYHHLGAESVIVFSAHTVFICGLLLPAKTACAMGGAICGACAPWATSDAVAARLHLDKMWTECVEGGPF